MHTWAIVFSAMMGQNIHFHILSDNSVVFEGLYRSLIFVGERSKFNPVFLSCWEYIPNRDSEHVRGRGIELKICHLNLQNLHGLAKLHDKPRLISAFVEKIFILGGGNNIS